MAHSTSRDYDPLPLTNDRAHTDSLYNSRRSPGPDDPFRSNHNHELERSEDLTDRPRFMAAALYSEGPSIRDSYASSHRTEQERNSEYSASIYALNDPHAPSSLSTPYRDDPQDRGLSMSPLGKSRGMEGSRIMEEKRAMYASPKSKRRVLLIAGGAAVVVLIIVIAVGAYFGVKSHDKSSPASAASSDNGSSSDSGSSSSGNSGSSKSNLAVTGGDGSTVTMEDGSTFTYTNKFGGTWYWDVNDPFNNGAQAQSWTPALNETFNYGVDKIRGVNLGGWLTVEPPYVNNTTPAIDEWTLSQAMTADTANGGISQLENHYKTFITEQDFAQIAAAGLNYVRIPLPFWAIETRGSEPFLAHTAWTYFLKAIQWARKYGIRINLDYHALPGSQNGWNHSGKLGDINMLSGPMGLANAQRSLDHIRIIAEFISQPEYSSVVTMFGVVNEPQASEIGESQVQAFYLQAYEIVRKASGIGAGNGPIISFHDAFLSRTEWSGFLPGADRISLDSHPYLCFGTQSSAPMSSYATTPCDAWGAGVNSSMSNFGLTQAGEFSNAVTDCGLWVNGVNQGVRYLGTYVADPSFKSVGSCDIWTDWQAYDQPTKDAIKQFALASMDALQNWFFWTWKIGNSSVTGKVESPAWSYQLGLQQGWMPIDPREAVGVCGNTSPWSPPLAANQLGTEKNAAIAASVSAQYPWPPSTIVFGGAPSELPTYTPTGAVPTLPAPTFTQSGVKATATPNLGDGWNNAQDSAGLMVNIQTCSYLDPWIGTTVNPPSPLCTPSKSRREPVLQYREPMITAMPAL
ncbi:glycoside hydrolase family 5 protein [Collybiopsis luxurians FD-317 M1]|uniref:glucan 1,3-beta-glucosidase n=1 Tax=Collybiopsis luxurians FD-317 M1 TaxID=944289 RepID=A0A0D0CKZ5_9AGAR|nr:glycoside hydrolase family 5 protein [Collybiopsis luxurians FD-317 M1]